MIHVFAEDGADTSILKTLMQEYGIKFVFMTIEAQPFPLGSTSFDHISDKYDRRLIAGLCEALKSKSKVYSSVVLHAPS